MHTLGAALARPRFSVLRGIGPLLAAAAVAAMAAAPASAGQHPHRRSPALTAVHAQRAWQHSTGRGVVVAVIDGGVAARNRNLAGQVLPGIDMVDPDRPLGWSDPVFAGGHGTGVASIIAGTGRGDGVYGIAPNAKILPVRVANAHGFAPDARVGRGIVWAVNHGADVINISLGGNHRNPRQYAGIRYALKHGVPVVAGAGNEGPANTGRFYPAAFPGVVAVGGTRTGSGSVADFSNRGRWVAVSAPSTMVWNTNSDGTRGRANGTSFASPAVAGAIALMLQADPNLTPPAIRRLLMATARDVGTPGVDRETGAGLLNVAAAVRAARHTARAH